MSTPAEDLFALAKDLKEVVTDIEAGNITDAIEAAGRIFGLITDHIPVAMLKASLTERDRTFVDLRVDVAESTKVEAEADLAEVEKLAGK